jgi:hypothetical protein
MSDFRPLIGEADALSYLQNPVCKGLPDDHPASDDQIYEEVFAEHGITKDTSDEELDDIATEVWETFRIEGIRLNNVKSALEHLRNHHA